MMLDQVMDNRNRHGYKEAKEKVQNREEWRHLNLGPGTIKNRCGRKEEILNNGSHSFRLNMSSCRRALCSFDRRHGLTSFFGDINPLPLPSSSEGVN